VETCTIHGLRFDSQTQSGCVLCRRAAHDVAQRNKRVRILLVLVVGAIALAAVSLHVKRKNDEAATNPIVRVVHDPSSPSSASAPAGAPAAASPARALSPPAPAITRAPRGRAPVKGWPTIVLLHGTGSSAERFIDCADAVNEAQLAAILPTAPARVASGGYGWPDDLEALEAYVAQAVDGATSFPIDRSRVLIGGYSSGAWVAIGVAARRPESYRAVLALAPIGPPRTLAAARGTSAVELTMFAGRNDEGALATAMSFEAAWHARGWPARIIPYDGGHPLPSSWPEMVKAAAASLASHLP
jgi:predicted esterase